MAANAPGPQNFYRWSCIVGHMEHVTGSVRRPATCTGMLAGSSCVSVKLLKHNRKTTTFRRVEVKLTICFYYMTDVSKCRRRAAWRAWWLWRWLYTLNDIQQMKGKCDWAAFPPGLNIKASPTGNVVNLPRLPPQWGTRSTMRKNGPSARGPEKDKHTCAQTKVHTRESKCSHAPKCSIVFNTWIVFTVTTAADQAFHITAYFFLWNFDFKMFGSILWDGGSQTSSLRVFTGTARKNKFQLSIYQSWIQAWQSARRCTQRMKDPTLA